MDEARQKYESVLSVYVKGHIQHMTDMKVLKKEMNQRAWTSFMKFAKQVEEVVRSWTIEDLDQFVKLAEDDGRVDDKMAQIIAEAFCRTHPEIDDDGGNDDESEGDGRTVTVIIPLPLHMFGT